MLVDTKVPHLSRIYDYAVPDRLSGLVEVGCRVRVPFGGQTVTGFVVADTASEDFAGDASALKSVVSSVPVFTPEVRALCAAVADHYAGTLADVVRFAVPPRVVAVEQGWTAERVIRPAPEWVGWRAASDSFADLATAGGAGRAAWVCPPAFAWQQEIIGLVTRAAAAGYGVIVVVPDGRDVRSLADPLQAWDSDAVAVLRTDEGAHERYDQFLKVLSGRGRVVVGTRASRIRPGGEPGIVRCLGRRRSGVGRAAGPLLPRPRSTGTTQLSVGRGVAHGGVTPAAPTCSNSSSATGCTEIDESTAYSRMHAPACARPAMCVWSPSDQVRRFPAMAVKGLRDALGGGPGAGVGDATGQVERTACAGCGELASAPM